MESKVDRWLIVLKVLCAETAQQCVILEIDTDILPFSS